MVDRANRYEVNKEDKNFKMRKEDYYIANCSPAITRIFVTQYHYLGKKGFVNWVCYGMYKRDESNECIGVAVYHGISVPETAVGAFGLDRHDQDGLWELGRLVLKPEYNGDNYGSFLVSNSIRMLRKDKSVRAIISYATSDRHVGTIYQATNWLCCGLTDKKSWFFVNGKIQERGTSKDKDGVWVNKPRKYRYILIFDKTLRLLWDTVPYPKNIEDQTVCYACDGKGILFSRSTHTPTECPICHPNKDEVNRTLADFIQ